MTLRLSDPDVTPTKLYLTHGATPVTQVICGEPGSGKSATIAALRAELLAQGWTV